MNSVPLMPMQPYIPLVFLAAAVSAGPALTFDGVIIGGPDRVGESISITVALSGNPSAPFYPAPPVQYFDEDITTDVDLFSSVVGTGITGNWTRPSNFAAAPYSAVSFGSYTVAVNAASEGGHIGLFFYGAPIVHLSAVFSSAQLGEGPGPVGYDHIFDGKYGSYVGDPGQCSLFLYMSDYQYGYEVNLTGLTVGAAAVPEPSTYGLILGGLALVGAAIRRRKAVK